MAKGGLSSDRKRAILIAAQDGLCAHCKAPMRIGEIAPHPLAPTLDHIVPRSLGGNSSLRNMLAKHYYCNHSRGNAPSTMQDWAWLTRVQAWIADHPELLRP